MIKYFLFVFLSFPTIIQCQDAVIPKPFGDVIMENNTTNRRLIDIYKTDFSFVLCEISNAINLKRISFSRSIYKDPNTELPATKIPQNYEIGIYTKSGELLLNARGLSAATPQQEGIGGNTFIHTISLDKTINLEADYYFVCIKSLSESHKVDGNQIHDSFNQIDNHKLSFVRYKSKKSAFPSTLPQTLSEANKSSNAEGKWESSISYFFPKLRFED